METRFLGSNSIYTFLGYNRIVVFNLFCAMMSPIYKYGMQLVYICNQIFLLVRAE